MMRILRAEARDKADGTYYVITVEVSRRSWIEVCDKPGQARTVGGQRLLDELGLQVWRALHTLSGE